MNRTLLSLGVIAAVLGAGVGLGTLTRPDAGRADGQSGDRQISVRNTVAVCPLPAAGGPAQSWVSAAVPPADVGPESARSGDGEATLSDLADQKKVRQRLKQPGATAVTPVTGAALPPQVGRARGSIAPGFSLQQTTRTSSGAGRGLSSTACAAPGTSFWFLGTSTAAGRQATLYLTNSEQVPAVVDLFLYGPKGQLDEGRGLNLFIRPGSQRSLLLGGLGAGTADASLNVVVRTGRVAAAVRDQEAAGKDGKGTDWVPPAGQPARQVLLPAPPAGNTQRLYLLAPGEEDGVAQVRLIGKSGSFSPVGAETVQLTGGKVAAVDISKATRGEPVAVSIDAEIPVLAGLRVVRGGSGKLSDVGYLAATGPLVNGAVIPENRSGSGGGARPNAKLYLTAPERSARATVTTLASGAPRQTDVEVRAGTTTMVDLPSPVAGGASFAVVVTPAPGSGELYGSWAQFVPDQRGEMFTTRPLADNGATVLVPRVAHDLSAGISRVK